MNNHIISVSQMLRRALNTLDYRLMEHGERVAYIVMQMYLDDGNYEDDDLSKICYLAMFHDIGAYQTEMLDSLSDYSDIFRFEIHHSVAHSVFSYIFLKSQACFEEYADAVLYHHFPYPKLLQSDCKNMTFAARLFMADRIDMLIRKGIATDAQKIIEIIHNPMISVKEAEHLKKLEEKNRVISKVLDGSYLDEFTPLLQSFEKNSQQMDALINLLPRAIDFRSESTVTHTVATVEIAVTLAELFGISPEEIEEIFFGALLHDIGKVSMSTMILEKDSKLSNDEFTHMKDHVVLSEYILKDCVSPSVYKIAVRHHEKLDGSGYPHGLSYKELSMPERIVAVADVLSALLGKRSYKEPFSPERTKAILLDMKEKGLLCRSVINLAIENFDKIDEKVQMCSEQALDRYDIIQEEAKTLIKKCAQFLEE